MIDPTTIVIKNASMYYCKNSKVYRDMPIYLSDHKGKASTLLLICSDQLPR